MCRAYFLIFPGGHCDSDQMRSWQKPAESEIDQIKYSDSDSDSACLEGPVVAMSATLGTH